MVTGKLWAASQIVDDQNSVIAHIPSNVCVEADDRLSVHLTNRDYVTLPPMQHGGHLRFRVAPRSNVRS